MSHTSVNDTGPTLRPGLVEAAVGLAVFGIVAYGVPPLLRTTGYPEDEPVGYGLILGALSGIAGIIAFAVAAALRVRRVGPFGVRMASWKWILAGLVGGIVVWVLARALTVAYTLLFGTPENVQATYDTAAQGGVVALVASTLFLGVLTPIGEELVFRGVVTTVLLRWGWLPGVLGSTLVFALFHGLTGFNIVLLTAFVEGFVAAELFRRSGSIWPSVVVHVTNNAIVNILDATLT